ncbi:MAG: hypothetical protein ACK5ME_01420 [Parahaliea sp.]
MQASKRSPIKKNLYHLGLTFVALFVSATAYADITLTPSTHDFGDIVVGEEAPLLRIVLANEVGTGSQPFLYSFTGTEAGADVDWGYTSINTCRTGNLAEGDSCIFDFHITPRELGHSTATLTFGFQPSQYTRTLTVTVNGVAAPPPGTGGSTSTTAVPALGAWAIGILSLGITGLAWWRQRLHQSKR